MRDRIESLLVAGATAHINRMPDRKPPVRARPQRVKVLKAGFFHEGRVPKVGEQIVVDADLVPSLLLRNLAELV